MEEMTRKTESQQSQSGGRMAKRIVGAIFGVIEVILAFRFIFKLLGADPDSGFVKFIYGITQWFVGLFEGIFSKVATSGLEVKSIFEPATLIAMLVVGLIAWLVMVIMTPRKGTRIESSEYTGPADKPQ